MNGLAAKGLLPCSWSDSRLLAARLPKATTYRTRSCRWKPRQLLQKGSFEGLNPCQRWTLKVPG